MREQGFPDAAPKERVVIDEYHGDGVRPILPLVPLIDR